VLQLPGLPQVNLVRPLTPDEKWVLIQWQLPIDRPILDSDLKRVGLVTNPGKRKRLEAKAGLSRGHWVGGKRVYYPIEIAHFLLALREEPPLAMTERSTKGFMGLKRARARSMPPAPEEPVKPAKPSRGRPRL
jgi:hypothetical protein